MFPIAAVFCEILLYNRQLVVLTYEPIYVARAAHR